MKKEERKIKKNIRISQDAERLNTILVENFISLQKALTNLTVKFDSLSQQISSLLQLFEISARSFADKLAVGVPDIQKDREFLEKLNRLLDQNKVIAKGLTLMEEKLKERLYGTTQPLRQEIRQARIQPARPVPFSSPEGYFPSSLEQEKPKPAGFEQES